MTSPSVLDTTIARSVRSLVAGLVITLGANSVAFGQETVPVPPVQPTAPVTEEAAPAAPEESPAPAVETPAEQATDPAPAETTAPVPAEDAAGEAAETEAAPVAQDAMPATEAEAEPEAAEGGIAGEAAPLAAEGDDSPLVVGEDGLPQIETGLPHDLSPWGMFMQADYVVKAVMIGLALASLITWIVWFAKGLQLGGAKGRAKRALRVVSQARTLEEAVEAMSKRRGIGALLVRSAAEEMDVSEELLGRVAPEGVKERVSSRLSRIEAAAGRKIARGTGVLASIGSVAPFVGLFGTVWGIMNSFIGIAETQTTNLAVVAPGIAEALLATALGLVAAIPAVIIYNVFARAITGYRQLLGDVSAGIERLVSRDLDRLHLPPAPQAMAAE